VRLPRPAAILRAFGVRTRIRPDLRGRLVHAGLLLAGLLLGLGLALPVREAAGRCAPGDGFNACALQQVWLPAAVTVLALLVAAHLVAAFVLLTVPALRARWRVGLRPVRMTRRQKEPPYASDPFLLAASWGVKTGDQPPPPEPTPEGWRAPPPPEPDPTLLD
jgi:hypothetical protein